MELEILVILGVEADEEAGRLVEYQLDLLGAVELSERRRSLLTIPCWMCVICGCSGGALYFDD